MKKCIVCNEHIVDKRNVHLKCMSLILNKLEIVSHLGKTLFLIYENPHIEYMMIGMNKSSTLEKSFTLCPEYFMNVDKGNRIISKFDTYLFRAEDYLILEK